MIFFTFSGSRCATGNKCSNKKFQRKEYCSLEIIKTDQKGYGLRTTQALPQYVIVTNTFLQNQYKYSKLSYKHPLFNFSLRDGFVIEYVGEVLNPREFDKRTKEYAKGNQEHFYFMSLKSDAIIDATLRGNCSRFINHSCEPNCETQKVKKMFE